MSFDGAAFGKEIVAEVIRYVDQTNKPLHERIAQLEKQLVEATETIAEISTSIAETVTVNLNASFSPKLMEELAKGLESVNEKLTGTLPDFSELVSKAVSSAVAALPTPVDGKSVTLAEVQPLIDKAVEEFADKAGTLFNDETEALRKRVDDRIAAIPVPKDGTSVTLEQVLGELQPMIEAKVDELTAFKDTADQMISSKLDAVDAAIAAIPVPKDGVSITLEDVRPIMDELSQKLNETLVQYMEAGQHSIDEAIAAIPTPKDGEAVTLEQVQPILDEAIAEVQKRYQLSISTQADWITEQGEELKKSIADAIAAIPVPKDGTSVTLEDVTPMLDNELAKKMTELRKQLDDALKNITHEKDIGLAAIAEAIENIPPGEPGKSVTIEDVRPIIDSFFEEQKSNFNQIVEAQSTLLNEVSSALTKAVDAGADAINTALEAIPDQIKEEAQTWLQGIPVPKDGKDADPLDLDWVAGVVSDRVNEAVKALPAPENGKDGRGIVSVKLDDEGLMHLEFTDGEKVGVELIGEAELGVIAEMAAKHVPVPKDGKDGVSLAGALINRDGELVVTLSNGETKELGPVVGKDGKGEPGKNGLDGVNFDDLEIELDEESRTLTFKAIRGENVKKWDFKLHYPIDMGVYKEGSDYLRGDGVTFGGSFWFAQKDAPEGKPGQSDDWRLAVKRGRDGKSVKEVGPQTNIPLGS